MIGKLYVSANFTSGENANNNVDKYGIAGAIILIGIGSNLHVFGANF